jgi:hypothetical protein
MQTAEQISQLLLLKQNTHANNKPGPLQLTFEWKDLHHVASIHTEPDHYD